MNKKDKKRLIYEAEKQTQEVKNLKRWLTKSIGISSITMIMAYFGVKSSGILFAIGIIGIKNGQKNIEKILSIVEAV